MIDLGLARIGRLVRHTPQKWKAIHVAGTNGKGSICAYLSAFLRVSGVRCGRFTSPHLIDRWDCITINDKTITESVFREAEMMVQQRNQDECIGASEFELLTATAFEVFHREKVDMGVVEVGLGGRLDATNVMENKVVTVISKIGLDHQAFLGDTVQAIAREKAGIMRAGVPCVLDASNLPSVRQVVEDYAKEIGTQVILSSTESGLMDEMADKDLEPHEFENLACANTAFHLAYTNLESPLHRQVPAMQEIQMQGRLQLIDISGISGRREPALLDGAHNQQSAEVLGRYVDRRLRPGSETITWVMAMSDGKAEHEILGSAIRAGDCVAAVEFGSVDGMPWVKAMDAQALLKAATALGVSESQQYAAHKDICGALRWATEVAAGGPLVVAGSLYLVSDVLRMKRQADLFKKEMTGRQAPLT